MLTVYILIHRFPTAYFYALPDSLLLVKMRSYPPERIPNNNMIGVILAIISALSLALSQVTLKRSFDNISPSVVFLFDSILGLLLWIPFSLFIGFQLSSLSEIFFYASVSAVLSEAYFFYVLSKGKISITGVLLASYPIYTILFSLFINHEELSLIQWISVSISILGTAIITWPNVFQKNDLNKLGSIFWALSGAIAVGLADTLAKNIIDKTSSASFLFVMGIIQIPIAYIFLKIEKQNFPSRYDLHAKINKYKLAVIGSILNVVGVALLYLAFENSLASIASPIIGTYPVLIVIFAKVFLKENLRRIDYLGISLVIIGVWQLGLSV